MAEEHVNLQWAFCLRVLSLCMVLCMSLYMSLMSVFLSICISVSLYDCLYFDGLIDNSRFIVTSQIYKITRFDRQSRFFLNFGLNNIFFFPWPKPQTSSEYRFTHKFKPSQFFWKGISHHQDHPNLHLKYGKQTQYFQYYQLEIYENKLVCVTLTEVKLTETRNLFVFMPLWLF